MIRNEFENKDQIYGAFCHKRKLLPCLFVPILLLFLAGCSAQKLEVQITAESSLDDDMLPSFAIETNLPDETQLLLTLQGTDEAKFNTSYTAQQSVTVQGGKAESQPFSNNNGPVPNGNFELKITMPAAEEQPQNVQKVIGKKGQRLTGEWVVDSENGNSVVEMTAPFQMQTLSASLTNDERVVYEAGLSLATLYLNLSFSGEYDYSRIEELEFRSATTSSYVPELILCSYEQTTNNMSKGKITSSTETNMAILTEELAGLPKGSPMENARSALGSTILFFDLGGDSVHMYNSNELNHINLALSQTIAWMNLEFESKEDFQAAGLI